MRYFLSSFPKDNLINVDEDKNEDYFFPMPPPKKIQFKITTHSLSLSAGNKKGKVFFQFMAIKLPKDNLFNVYEDKIQKITSFP